MRLIDADELEGAFLESARIIDNSELDEYAGRGLNCYEFKKLLDEQPTIEERPKGKWTNINDIPHCSVCGYIPPYDRHLDDIYYSKYCPECGAYLKGEENE